MFCLSTSVDGLDDRKRAMAIVSRSKLLQVIGRPSLNWRSSEFRKLRWRWCIHAESNLPAPWLAGPRPSYQQGLLPLLAPGVQIPAEFSVETGFHFSRRQFPAIRDIAT